ncbi:MAG: haloacid dehalogenase type II [Gammaproteobacteria bacterium]
MNRVIVFDVNETLLDLAALDPLFTSAFGNAEVRREWFAQVLLCAMTTSLTGAYADFGVVTAAALERIAARHRVGLSRSQRDRILGGMRTLPPHPEVPRALARLREGGLRLACLTNSAPETAHAQIHNAGLLPYFEDIFSVDDVRRYKPAPEPYRMAAYRLGVDVAQVRLVAAH